MKHITHLVLPVLISTFIAGCGSAPTVRDQPQWVRNLTSIHAVNPKTTMKVAVSGSTAALLGSEQLLADNIHEHLSTLLKRRGYTVENSGYDYNAKLLYMTERNEKFRSPSGAGSSNLSAARTPAGMSANTARGLGVIVAQAVRALTTRSAGTGSLTIDQPASYSHTIAIEIRNLEGSIAWKGESTWDSNELDIMDRIVPAMQMLLSDLPADSLARPAIREVKDTHAAHFYKLECAGAAFACPALPYGVAFDYTKVNASAKMDVPRTIRDPYALAGYIDLLQTAEYALPSGNEEDWEDPMKLSLWKRVTLGGQYMLGNEEKPINIIIKLIATTNGYAVDACSVVSDDDFATFSTELSNWKRALGDYFDVYAQ